MSSTKKHKAIKRSLLFNYYLIQHINNLKSLSLTIAYGTVDVVRRDEFDVLIHQFVLYLALLLMTMALMGLVSWMWRENLKQKLSVGEKIRNFFNP